MSLKTYQIQYQMLCDKWIIFLISLLVQFFVMNKNVKPVLSLSDISLDNIIRVDLTTTTLPNLLLPNLVLSKLTY